MKLHSSFHFMFYINLLHFTNIFQDRFGDTGTCYDIYNDLFFFLFIYLLVYLGSFW
jgi:hypothetical protein